MPSRPRDRRRWRRTRRAVWVLLALVVLFFLTLSRRDADLFPARGDALVVHVMDHGYHTGLVIELSHLRRVAALLDRQDPAAAERIRWLVGRFPNADWIEVGWGDADFYRATPTVSDVNVWLGLRALFVPTATVLQVVPGFGPSGEAFPGSGRAALSLSPQGMRGLAQRLADTVPEPPPVQDLGPSLYGGGAFYPARLDYHLFRTCNHWTAWLLRGAGVPASAVPGTLSATLMLELHWRTDSAP